MRRTPRDATKNAKYAKLYREYLKTEKLFLYIILMKIINENDKEKIKKILLDLKDNINKEYKVNVDLKKIILNAQKFTKKENQ